MAYADQEKKSSGWIKALNLLLVLAGLAAIGLGLVALWLGKADMAAVGVGAGIVLIFVGTIDRFEFIKGLGIEAKTRDLTQKINDADQILSRIREMTTAFAPSLVSVSANAGRWSDPQPPELVYKLARAADMLMMTAGESRQKIRDSLRPWAQMAARDITYGLLEKLYRATTELSKLRQKAVDQWPVAGRIENPEFSKLVDQAAEVRHYMGKLNSLQKVMHEWVPAECAFRLRELVKDVPTFINKEVADEVSALAMKWVPEITYLADNDDFRDPQEWFAMFDMLRQEQLEALKGGA